MVKLTACRLFAAKKVRSRAAAPCTYCDTYVVVLPEAVKPYKREIEKLPRAADIAPMGPPYEILVRPAVFSPSSSPELGGARMSITAVDAVSFRPVDSPRRRKSIAAGRSCRLKTHFRLFPKTYSYVRNVSRYSDVV